jgi:hypothetical protein
MQTNVRDNADKHKKKRTGGAIFIGKGGTCVVIASSGNADGTRSCKGQTREGKSPLSQKRG